MEQEFTKLGKELQTRARASISSLSSLTFHGNERLIVDVSTETKEMFIGLCCDAIRFIRSMRTWFCVLEKLLFLKL